MTRTKDEESTKPQSGDDVASRATEGMLGPNPFVGLRWQDVLEQFQTIAEATAKHPQLVLAQQAKLAHEFIAILLGTSELAPSPEDKRFHDADWNNNRFRKAYLQGYLAWARGLDEFVGNLGFDERDTQRARFAVSLVTDALAPSNMPWANPVALKRFRSSPVASVRSRGCVI